MLRVRFTIRQWRLKKLQNRWVVSSRNQKINLTVNMNNIERQLQLCLNKIEKWAMENGFKLSSSKTVVLPGYSGFLHH
jgi:hypothetical protein